MSDAVFRPLLPDDALSLLTVQPPVFRTEFGIVSDIDSVGRGRYYLPLMTDNDELLLATGTFRVTGDDVLCAAWDGIWLLSPAEMEDIFRSASLPLWPPSRPGRWIHPDIEFPPPVPQLSEAMLTRESRDSPIIREAGEYFQSDDWSCRYYRTQARLGFIAVAGPTVCGWRLLPQLQTAYALLDWPDLRIDRRVRKIMESGRMEKEGIRLEISNDPGRVLDELGSAWGEKSWLYPPYVDCVRRLGEEKERREDPGFRIWGVRLTAEEGAVPVAGELGYTIGRTYTSLTGFFRRGEARWNNFGKLQLVLLAHRLEAAGVAFWNLGHPYMEYKLKLGARVVDRDRFLERWDAACGGAAADLTDP